MGMRKFILLGYSILLSSTLFSFMNNISIADLEHGLDMQIGRPYDRLGPGWKVLFEDKNNIILEKNVSKDCSYTVHIPKDTYRIDSWKLTSPRESCDNIPVTGA
jgi:hypothetical protein